MFKSIKEVSKKKAAIIAMTGVLSVGVIGGGSVYAYKDAWTAKIQKGISIVAQQVFKEDIGAAITKHGNQKEAELRTYGEKLIDDVVRQFEAFKAAEIKRGKDELDAKYNSDTAKLKEATDNAVSQEKSKQQAEDNATIDKEKADMDAVVDKTLDKVPN